MHEGGPRRRTCKAERRARSHGAQDSHPQKMIEQPHPAHALQVGGSYEALASEYYDAVRHPTCANFREASRLIINSWLDTAWPDSGWVCEVGAGQSLLAELIEERELPFDRVLITDASPSMLRHSQHWQAKGAT